MANKGVQASQQYISCVLSEDGDDLFAIGYNKDLTIKALKDTIHQLRHAKLKHISPEDLKLHLIALGDDGTLDDVEGKRNVPEGSTKMRVPTKTLQHYIGNKSLDTLYIFVEFQPPPQPIICWVEGDRSSFAVDIPFGKPIGELKDAILAKNPKTFPDIDPKDLELFKANIPDTDVARKGFDFNDDAKLQGSDKLWIGDFKDGHIHIAIKRSRFASVISCNACFGRTKRTLCIERGQTLADLKKHILKKFDDVFDGILTEHIKLYLEKDDYELEDVERLWRSAEAAGKRNKFGDWEFDLRVETDAKDFSSYRKLDTVLVKLGLPSATIHQLSTFTQPSVDKLNDRDVTLINHLKKDIALRWSALKSFTYQDNEAKRNEFISPFLISVINSFDEPTLELRPQRRIDGSIGKGPVDYTIEYKDNVICVTECKATEVVQGISQNLAQLNSAAEENTRKRKRKLPEDTDEQKREALYGIVSTGDGWYFLLFLFLDSNVQVAVSKQMTVMLGPEPGPESSIVCDQITNVYKVVKGMLQEQMDGSGSSVQKYEKLLKRIRVK